MRNPFHFHEWTPVSVTNSGNYAFCWVIVRCTRCGRLKSRELKGHCTIEQLRGDGDVIAKTLAGIERASK